MNDLVIERADRELLECRVVELDPILHGFHGAFMELRACGEAGEQVDYEVREVSLGTGDTVRSFATTSIALAYSVYRGEQACWSHR